MSEGPSILSLAAACLYALAALACLIAYARSIKRKLPLWHARSWLSLAILFALLIVLRVAMIEDYLRLGARALLREQGVYGLRREWQTLVVITFLLTAATIAVWLARRALNGSNRRPDIAVKLANAAGLGMVGLLALRLISLHMIDKVLNGPLKLNWIGDVGMSFAVLAAAAYYAWQVTSRRRAPRR